MNLASGALSTLRRLSIAIAIAILFLFGLGSTVYLSLRSPEVTVPDVMGKDRFEAERVLGSAGLNFRVRATRPSQLKADTVLFQLPRGGEVVKAGQTIAMDISRPVKEGESSISPASEPTPADKVDNRNTNDSAAANNENKPKRNKNTNTNANKNANDNSNAKAGNRNANSNRPAANKNANSGNSNKATNLNSNRPPSNANANPARNDNRSTRPPAAKPSPVSKPPKEN